MLLKLAFGIWLASAGADNVTTYHAVTQPPVWVNGNLHFIREGNPLLATMQDKPAMMLTVASAADVASAALWLHVGKTHKWAAVGAFIGQAAFRGWLVSRTLDNLQTQRAWAAQSVFVRTP
jgi:hypothetical protein